MSNRNRLALKRLGKMLAIAVLPVLIASLQAETLDVRATVIAVAIAALAAVQKYVAFRA